MRCRHVPPRRMQTALHPAPSRSRLQRPRARYHRGGSQWCTAKRAEDAESNPDAKLQRSSQRIAIEQNYDRVKAQYDARLADAFRARLVKPPDVPDRAPSLAQFTAGC